MEEKRLKIALCCDAFYPMIDGVINVVDNYARILSRKHDVTVFVPKSPDKNFKDDYPYKVVRCKTFPIKLSDYMLPTPGLDGNFKKELKQKFDIVHIHSPFAIGRKGVKYARKNGTPVVVTLHSQYRYDFKQKTKSEALTKCLLRYIAKTYNRCDELWTMNPKMEELAHEYGYKGKVYLIQNGVDLKKEDVDFKALAEFRANLAKPEEKVFLYVGRINPLKNIEFILKVCKQLKSQGFAFKMIFVGTGAWLNQFEKMKEDMNLGDVVNFVGKVADRKLIQMYYNTADLFVFPSNYDTDGIVKSEAAAFGTPTIFLRKSICASIITDNFNGFLADEDVNQFAQRIVEVFSDEKTYKEVCKNAEATLFKTWNEIVAQAEKHYFELIEQSEKRKASEGGKKNKKRGNGTGN